ncbi:MAG: HWE histidine kinase domain-containing protein [Microvirga sp.]
MNEAVSTPSRRLPPDDVLAASKAQLIAALAETLKSRGLTQVRAAQLCGTDQPTLSKVLTGRSDRVTVDKLMRWLAALDRPVGLQVAGGPGMPGVASPDGEGWPALADAVPCLIWVNRPDGTLLYCNRRVRDRYGERFGPDRAARDRIIHPAERPLFDALRREATAEDRDFEMDLRLEDGDGGYRWHRLLVSPIRDASGAPRALAGAAIEIDDHKTLEAALSESEERFRLATEAFQGGVSDHDAATSRVERTKRHLEIIGETSATFPALATAWYERIHPEDRPAYDEARRPLFEHRASQYEAEYRIRHRDGHWVWIWHRAIAKRDADGRLERVIGSLIDITERKKAEEQRELLIHELNHRVKNTLATVQSLAAQTMRSAASLADFTGAFEARLFALSKTHNLLTEGAWAGASLRALLEVEVAPYAQDGEAGRFSLAGLHDVHLAARAAVALGLAFHELATNAVKYGALSNETGSVSVMWTLENAAREQQLLLHLIWTEQGGPPVEKPRRRGFGTRLIERGITLELGGEVELEHLPEGLRCEMHVPLDMPTMAFVPAP